MAPYHADPVSSDDDEAPESVSLVQSKLHIQNRDNVLKKIQVAEWEKKRARNRERDRRLKEQAEGSKRKRKEYNESDPSLVARMERAIQEAQEEMEEGSESSEEEDENESEDEDSDEEFKGIQETLVDEDEDEDEEMSDAETPSTKPKTNPNHLPDHLFTTAFISQSARSKSKRKADDPTTKSLSKKRVRSNKSPKDVIIGSRTIRTLGTVKFPSGAATIPSAKVKKFLNQSLGLKGGNPRTRGWERKPANIGVMRQNGPAASFVRNR